MEITILIILFCLVDGIPSNSTCPCPIDFSVIIAVYNTGRYLKESIESVLRQTIGFSSHIEIVLVNDGSTDESEQICLDYCRMYPKNIRYIHQIHSGVSVARNRGLQLARGRYINFLDSDDRWSHNAFKCAKFFLDQNLNVNIVSCRVRYFEASNNYAEYDYKFTTTGTVSLLENYTKIQLYAAPTFIRSSAIGAHRFDERLERGEDAHFINALLLDNPTYVVIREVEYEYRRRNDFSSADQNNYASEAYFNPFITYCYEDLFMKSRLLYGRVVEFIQFLFFSDYLNRLHQPSYLYLLDDEYELYLNKMETLLKEVSVSLIERHTFDRREKLYILLQRCNITEYYNNSLTSEDFFGGYQIPISLGDIKSCLLLLQFKRKRLKVSLTFSDYLYCHPHCSCSYHVRIFETIIKGTSVHMRSSTFVSAAKKRYFNTNRIVIFELPIYYLLLPLNFMLLNSRQTVRLNTPPSIILHLNSILRLLSILGLAIHDYRLRRRMK